MGGPSGTSYRGALEIAEGRLARAMVIQPTAGGDARTVRSSGTYATTASTLTFSAICPGAAEEQLRYGVFNDQIVLTDPATGESLTFQLR